MVTLRDAVAIEDKWNVEAIYPSPDDWQKDFEKAVKLPDFATYRGKLSEETALKELLNKYFTTDRHLSKLYTYAHLRHDEDVANDFFKKNYAKISALCHKFREETSWIEPEILSLPKEIKLEEYQIFLEKLYRLRPHTLSADKEYILALAGKALDAPHKAFGAFNNADIKFPNLSNGLELTHGKFQLYLRSPDRKIREEAFKAMHHSFAAYENTICELINGEIQRHVFERKARNYNSCLEAALFPHQIDVAVYTSLISSVKSNLPALHRYLKMRKEHLNVAELHLYDMYVPLVADVDFSFEYEEAEKLIIESVAPLGEEYQKILRKGLLKDRWVDRYENAQKRSGAYSSGCFDSMPYILMNYQKTLNDVKTLAHEAGHSMHSYLSNKNQPYQYSSYPIFVAEVASTFNEELLCWQLLSKLDDKKKRAYIINQKIDDIRATFFRQTMFAEFELKLHEWADQDIPLTPALLKEEYYKLNQEYFGPDVVVDKEVEIEWARIPHFYYNFYVYQYATGISAALSLSENLTQENYLKFLSSGCSKFPLDLLKLAGVDMKSSKPIEATIHRFEKLVKELQEILPKS